MIPKQADKNSIFLRRNISVVEAFSYHNYFLKNAVVNFSWIFYIKLGTQKKTWPLIF